MTIVRTTIIENSLNTSNLVRGEIFNYRSLLPTEDYKARGFPVDKNRFILFSNELDTDTVYAIESMKANGSKVIVAALTK